MCFRPFGSSGLALPVAAEGLGRVPWRAPTQHGPGAARRRTLTLSSGAASRCRALSLWVGGHGCTPLLRWAGHGINGTGLRMGLGIDRGACEWARGMLAARRALARYAINVGADRHPTPTTRSATPGPWARPEVRCVHGVSSPTKQRRANMGRSPNGEGTAPRSSPAAERKGVSARRTGTVLGRRPPRDPAQPFGSHRQGKAGRAEHSNLAMLWSVIFRGCTRPGEHSCRRDAGRWPSGGPAAGRGSRRWG